MATIGDLVIRLMIEGKQAVATVQNFGQVASQVVNTTKKTFKTSEDSVAKLKEYQFQTNRITLEDYRKYLERRLSLAKNGSAGEKLAYAQLQDRIKKLDNEAKNRLNNVGSAFNRIADFSQKAFFMLSSFKMLTAPLGDLINTSNEFDKSNAKIEASAKLTGVALDQLKSTAAMVKEELDLNTIQSNELTISLTKLGQKAGDVSGTGDAIKRLLDLAAAQGMDAQQALVAIDQAILGIDEGTDKLFQKNPSAIYDEYAKSIHTTAGRLNDQQKAQALLTAITEAGLKVEGEYSKFLETDAGKKAANTARTTEMKAELGKLINLAYVPLLELSTPLVKLFTDMDSGLQKVVVVTGVLAVVGWKLIPMIKAWDTSIKVLGISIKTALGWIGLIIAVATLLYTAWSSNLGSIQEKVKIAWAYMKAFFSSIWELAKELVSRYKEIFGGLGDLIIGVFTFDKDRIQKAFQRVTNAVAGDWDQAMNRIKEKWNTTIAEGEKAAAGKTGKETTTTPTPGPGGRPPGGAPVPDINAEADAQKRLTELQATFADLRVQNMKNEHDRKLAEVDLWFSRESIKYAGQSDIIEELEIQKRTKIDEINLQFTEKEAARAKELSSLKIQIITDEFVKRRAEVDAWFREESVKWAGNVEALAILEVQKKQKLDDIDKEYSNKQAQRAKELTDLKISAMTDEFYRRRTELDSWFAEESAKWTGNAEAITALEAQKNQRLYDINQDYADNFLRQHQGIINVIAAGYDTFFQTLTDAEMTGQQRREAIFESMKNTFIGNLQNMLSRFISTKARELVIHLTTEKTKTIATKTQSAVRSAASVTELLKEGVAVVGNIAKYIGMIAVKIFSWFASKGPIGLLLGIASAAGVIALVKAAVKSHMSFARGGEVTEPTNALIGDAGPEIIAPKKDFVTVVNEMIASGNFNINSESISVFIQTAVSRIVQLLESMLSVLSMTAPVKIPMGPDLSGYLNFDTFTSGAAALVAATNDKLSSFGEKLDAILAEMAGLRVDVKALKLEASINSESLAITVSDGNKRLLSREY